MRDEIKAALVCALLVAAVSLVLLFHHPAEWTFHPIPLGFSESRTSENLPPAQFDQFLARYGPPTSEEGSPHGVLSPPLFTKWLDYEPEHLRVAFVAAQAPETIAGTRWVLISFVDAVKTEPVSAQEAGRRLMSRQR